MTTYVLEYRCRRCGETFDDYEDRGLDQVHAEDYLCALADPSRPEPVHDGSTVMRLWLHGCPDGGSGVGDLAGAREEGKVRSQGAATLVIPEGGDASFDTVGIPPQAATLVATFDRPGTWKITVDEDMRGTLEEVSE